MNYKPSKAVKMIFDDKNKHTKYKVKIYMKDTERERGRMRERVEKRNTI